MHGSIIAARPVSTNASTPPTVVYLRNAHPSQTVWAPRGDGWLRWLMPGETTCLPAGTTALPAIRQAIAAGILIIVADGTSDADTRQRRALRADLARALAAAEEAGRMAAEHVRGRIRVRHYRRANTLLWPPQNVALLRERWGAGTPGRAIARELGVSTSQLFCKARLEGLTRRTRASQAG